MDIDIELEMMNSKSKSEHFVQLIEANKGIIYKVSNSYCRDPEDRKDLIQEIIIQLWGAHSRYDANYKFSTWMYRIALNVAISFYGKEKRRAIISHPFSDHIFNELESVNEETNADLEHLNRFISELRALDRALIILYLEEKSQKEIGEILGLTQTNVSTKIVRIKKILKNKFSKIKKI